jgi:hypothetical protein
MQCSNCGFQNMPGSEECGRCRTSLGLATAVLDVHPPRASSARKRLRRMIPAGRALYQARDALQTDIVADQARRARGALAPLPPLILFLVPGLSHLYLRQPIRANLFFWSFFGCLLWLLLFYGSTSPGFWLGMAFSVHSSAVLDIITQTFAAVETRERIIRSLVVSAVLGVLIYLPIFLVIGQVAQPHQVETWLGKFAPGDVILVNRRHAPQRGDVVLYRIDQTLGRAGYGGRERVYQYYTGENIDRILAVPGDHVQSLETELLVNGEPSLWQPLNQVPLPSGLDITLGPDFYLIFPSGAPGVNSARGGPSNWQVGSGVRRSDIIGRAYLRSHPLSRFQFLD